MSQDRGWVCPGCFNFVPYGYPHLCPSDNGIYIKHKDTDTSQLEETDSMKLDKIIRLLEAIKELR
jgi:hypothetical protein